MMSRFLNTLKNHRLFFLIFGLALFLRAYRLDELTTFGGDQGQDFLVIKDMVLHNKWTLIGIKTSVGSFFQGPVYLYILYPFFVLFRLHPIAGAVAAVTMSVSTLTLLYFTCIRYFSKESALFSSLLFAVSPELVKYGNTPLYQHFLPFFIVLSIYIFLRNKDSLFTILLLGIVVGIGIELHLLNISLCIAYALFYILFSKERGKKILSYGAGFIIGISPTLIFELRHQFLNVHLFLQYQQSTESAPSLFAPIKQIVGGSAIFLAGNSGAIGSVVFVMMIILLLSTKISLMQFTDIKRLTLLTLVVSLLLSVMFSTFAPHYLLPFWILSIMIFPFLLIQKFSKKIAFALISIVIITNLIITISQLSYNHGYFMPSGLTLRKINTAGMIINKDSHNHKNFNVASILDGNTRNYPLRYATEIYGAKPDAVENYPANDYLYVTASSDKKIFESNTWEVNVMKPFIIGKKWNLGDNIYVYRLDRLHVQDED